MKVAFLTTRIEKPSSRQRILNYIPYLKREGIETGLFTIPPGFLERYRLFKGLEGFDLVFLHRKLLSLPDWKVLRKAARTIVFDFDDAVMFNDPNSGGKPESGRRLKRFERTVRESDTVICGNGYLKGWAERYNKNVVVIPTPVDMNRYTPKPSGHQKEYITIGWIGSASTLLYMENMLNVWDEVARRFPHVRVKIVADRFFDCERMVVVKKRWAYRDEIEDLHSFDMGVMPLTDDPWSKGKCAFKLIQYMAVGLPAVASPVGMNKEVIKDGFNGLLAQEDAEWVEKLSLLVEDRQLREEIGRRARASIKERYSLEANAPRLADVLRKTPEG